jgi:thymidylate kinase
MKLITISGLDGSGKTTQLDLLEKKLKEKHQVERLHMIDFSIANKILKKKSDKKGNQAKTKTGFWGLFMRKIAIAIDSIRFRIHYRVKVFENKVDYLLIDRYFYDQIINIKYLDPKENYEKEPFWQKITESQIIQPDLKIYLKINPEKILTRARKIEQNRNYLFQKNNLYNFFSKKWKLTEIKGESDKNTIKKTIKKLL